MAWIRQQGLEPYIGYKRVNVVDRPPGGSPADVGALRPQVCYCSFSEPRPEPKSRTDSGVHCKKKKEKKRDELYFSYAPWYVIKIKKLNQTKWSLFFDVVSLAVHTLLPSMLQLLDSIQRTNIWAYKLLSPPSDAKLEN